MQGSQLMLLLFHVSQLALQNKLLTLLAKFQEMSLIEFGWSQMMTVLKQYVDGS
jgi:hypothetical protein